MRSWTGIRRPVEDIAIRRLERKRNNPPSSEWWRKWNSLDGGEWAREKAEEEAKAQRLLKVLMQGDEDKETEGARRLARALGIDLGGDR